MTTCAREIISSLSWKRDLDMQNKTRVLKEGLILTKFTCDMDEVEMPWKAVFTLALIKIAGSGFSWYHICCLLVLIILSTS